MNQESQDNSKNDLHKQDNNSRQTSKKNSTMSTAIVSAKTNTTSNTGIKHTFSGNQKSRRELQRERPTEKQISDDLWAVQKQVDKVMSNIETFETKKRELSQKKINKAGVNAMFQQRVSPTIHTFGNVVKMNNEANVRASNPNFEYGQGISSPMAIGKISKNRS